MADNAALKVEPFDEESGSLESPRLTTMRTTRRVSHTSKASDGFDVDALLNQHMLSAGDGDSATGLPDASTLRRDVATLSARLKAKDAFLLNPASKFMQYWDFFTLSALFFTATVTPYEVCMLWEETKFADGAAKWLGPLFVINWIVNLIFMVDICFQFFLPYRESIKKGGGTVKSHRRIARKYLCGWFTLDFISIVPVDNIMMFIDTSQIRGASVLGAIRMLRLLRLIKLARILRASRIFSRWENSVSMSYAKQDLIRWSLIVLVLLHWLACLLGLLAQLMAAPRDEMLEAEVYRVWNEEDATCYGCMPRELVTTAFNTEMCSSSCLTPCEATTLARMQLVAEAQQPFHSPTHAADLIAARVELVRSQENWLCRYQAAGKVRAMPTWHGELWMAALYVAMVQLGGGVGSIVPENFIEYIVFLLGIVLGSVTWAMVVGTICAQMSTGDPHSNAFKANMDSLNYFLEDMNLPHPLRIRAREYLRNGREMQKKLTYNDLIGGLSPELRADIVLHMSARTLEHVWYLGSLEQEARVELAMKLARSGYAAREKVSSINLCILMRGVAAKAGNILTPSCHWGDDLIVSSAALRDLRPASALTYVEVASLSRPSLDEILEQYPKSAAIIRQAAMKVAMRRAVVIISEYVRTRQDMRSSTDERTKKAAHSSLTSAFGGGADPAADPTMILRIITGAKLRDVVDGELVEEVYEPPAGAPSAQGGGGDVSALRHELGTLKSDLADMKDMVRALLAQGMTKK